MPRHWVDLPDAATLETEKFQLAEKIVQLLVRTKAMGVIHGEAGTGKTFAVEAAMEAITATAPPGLSVIMTKAPQGATLRRITERLWLAVSGEELSGPTRFHHMDRMRKELARGRTLLIVDEAQNLTVPGIELIRELFDEPTTTVSFLFVGGNGCWERISAHPMLRSRILWRMAFTPLSDEQIVDLAPAYHPIYRNADRALIAAAEKEIIHGYLRDLASLTFTLVDLAAASGLPTLDETLLANAYLLLGGAHASSA